MNTDVLPLPEVYSTVEKGVVDFLQTHPESNVTDILQHLAKDKRLVVSKEYVYAMLYNLQGTTFSRAVSRGIPCWSLIPSATATATVDKELQTESVYPTVYPEREQGFGLRIAALEKRMDQLEHTHILSAFK